MPSSSRQPRPRPEFLFLGGHRAVDFANTAVPPPGPGIDFLQEWSDVVDWLSDARLSDSAALHLPSSKGKAALAALKGFRDDWRNELARVLAEGSVSDDFMGRINRHLNEEPFTESLCRTGYTGLHLVRSASKLRGGKLALALVARQVAQFLADANLAYLRRCANTTSCVLYFYDTTKNHHRHWCSVATCGNRHKVAEFRRRKTIEKTRSSMTTGR